MKHLTASGEFEMRNETVTLTFVTNSVSYYFNTGPVDASGCFLTLEIFFNSQRKGRREEDKNTRKGKRKEKVSCREKKTERCQWRVKKSSLTPLLMQSSVSVALYVALYLGQVFQGTQVMKRRSKKAEAHIGHLTKRQWLRSRCHLSFFRLLLLFLLLLLLLLFLDQSK